MTCKRKLDEDYEKISQIGCGSYGVVYKVRNKGTQDIEALKRVKLNLRQNALEGGIPSSSLREIAALKNLKHPNIVSLREVRHTGTSLYLIFEHMDQDLKKTLDETKAGLPKMLVRSYMWQLLKAIAFCHSKGILHRDLKLQNLLVNTKDDTIKLADFGLARNQTCGINNRHDGQTKFAYTTEVVTLWYRAPELLLGLENYGAPVDIWSLGCIFFEILTKKVLFPGDSEIGQLFKIFRVLGTPREELWPDISKLPHFKQNFPNWSPLNSEKLLPGHEDATELLKQMLIYNPEKRIPPQEALKHKYFDEICKRTTLRDIQNPTPTSPTKRPINSIN